MEAGALITNKDSERMIMSEEFENKLREYYETVADELGIPSVYFTKRDKNSYSPIINKAVALRLWGRVKELEAALATRTDVNQVLVERIAYLEKQLVIDSTDDDPFSYMSYADLKAENKVKDDNLYNLTRRNQGLVEALERALFGGGMKHVSQQREKHAIALEALAKHKVDDASVEQKKDYSELVYLLRNAVRTFDTAEMLDAAANAIEELSKKDKPC